MSETSYPSSFPLVNIQSVVNTLRNKTVKDDIDQFAYDVWVIQGYGQKAILGSPQIGAQSSSEPCDSPCDSPCDKGEACCSKEAVADLEAVCGIDTQCEVALQALEESISETPNTQMAIPWSIIIPFLLKELLKRYEEWRNNSPSN